MMSGCGKDETVQTSAAPQGMEAEQTQDEKPGEGEQSPENTTVAEENDFSEEIIVEEPLKTQLTEELLEENQLDTSVVGNARTTKGCSFTVPEGFAASEEAEGMYVTDRYPIDASTIYYAQLEQDMALQLMTKESFKEQTQADFRQDYGEDVEVSVDSFEQIRIQEYPAFKIRCHYQVGDVTVIQLAYVINADKSYVITYSQTGDYDRMEEYEASAETIRVEN